MPSFTTQLPNLQALGPVVDIRIWVGTAVENALKKAGSPIPQPVPAKGMIDTGATSSVIQPAIAKSLGLQPVGIVNISTPPRPTFRVTSISFASSSPTASS